MGLNNKFNIVRSCITTDHSELSKAENRLAGNNFRIYLPCRWNFKSKMPQSTEL
jgi:hypothetical protein